MSVYIRAGCAALMKKCIQCREVIQKSIPFIVCCGGRGVFDIRVCVSSPFSSNSSGKTDNDIQFEFILLCSSPHVWFTLFFDLLFLLMIILEPEELTTTCSPKRELTQHDIGTLKQQLQEIKEQVRIYCNLAWIFAFFYILFICI